MLHAHVESVAVDCDGRITRTYTMRMNEDELKGKDEPNWFGEIEFIDRVVCHIGSFYACRYGGTLSVTPLYDPYETPLFPDRDKLMERLIEWNEMADEGSVNVRARVCVNTQCDLDEPATYRDHRAESMGY